MALAACKCSAMRAGSRITGRSALPHLHNRLSTVARVASPDVAGPPGPGDGIESWEVPVSERRRLEHELRAARAASERLPAEMRFSREQLFYFGPAEVLTYLRYILAYEFDVDVDLVTPATTLVSLCGAASEQQEAQAADMGRLVAAVDTGFHAFFPLLGQLDWGEACVQSLADAICNDLAAEWN